MTSCCRVWRKRAGKQVNSMTSCCRVWRKRTGKRVNSMTSCCSVEEESWKASQQHDQLLRSVEEEGWKVRLGLRVNFNHTLKNQQQRKQFSAGACKNGVPDKLWCKYETDCGRQAVTVQCDSAVRLHNHNSLLLFIHCRCTHITPRKYTCTSNMHPACDYLWFQSPFIVKCQASLTPQV